jgi:hypothetical protein
MDIALLKALDVDVPEAWGGKQCQEHRVLDAMVKEQFYVLHVMALAKNPS